MASVSISFDPGVRLESLEKPVLSSGTRRGSRAETIIHARPGDKKRRRRVFCEQDDVEQNPQSSPVDKMRVKVRRIDRNRDSVAEVALRQEQARLHKPYRLLPTARSQWSVSTPTSVPLSGIDILISGCGLFPHDLSALTTIYHAVVALDLIRSEPSRFPSLITTQGASKDSSYFAYIGPRFGSSDCLDNALRCLFSKTRSILAPSCAIPEAVILSQYDQALASLQAAVNSPSWSDPEVLCATSILALFELFNSPSLTYWSHHVAGAARLVQSRGPGRFTTDFDIALFKAIFPAIGTECLIKGLPCFLEEEPWQGFFTKVYPSDDPLTDDGRLMRDYAVDMVKIPGLQCRILDILGRGLDAATEEVIELTERVRWINNQSRRWHTEFTQCLAACQSMETQEYDSRMTQFAAGVTFHVLSCMFLAALDPVLRLPMIEEAEGHARELKKAQLELSPLQHGPAFYVAQKARISEATLCAAPIWKEAVGSGNLLESWRFHVWCRAVKKHHSSKFVLEQISRANDPATQIVDSVSLVRFGFELLTLDRRIR